MRRLVASLALLVVSAEACARTSLVPMQFRTVSGIRPFLPVELNGRAFLFMLHANANFLVMTNHANARKASISVPPSTTRYGIEASGKVSALGRASATLDRLSVGGKIFRDVRLEVFETPQDPPMQGMLGIGWMRASKCIVDYDRLVVAIPRDDADARRGSAELQRRGYVAHRMHWNAEAKRYYVLGTLNGTPARFDISTVTNNVLDLGFASRAGVARGPVVAQAGGPKGSLVDQYIAKRQVTIEIEGQRTAPSQPLMWDIAGYDSKATSTEQATLGAEFMLANQAVVDFGSETLFLPG